MELVVKSYELRPGGGVGAFPLWYRGRGTLQAEVKSQRIMHGSAAVLGRWREVGLIGGGTGIAPLVRSHGFCWQTNSSVRLFGCSASIGGRKTSSCVMPSTAWPWTFPNGSPSRTASQRHRMAGPPQVAAMRRWWPQRCPLPPTMALMVLVCGTMALWPRGAVQWDAAPRRPMAPKAQGAGPAARPTCYGWVQCIRGVQILSVMRRKECCV